MTSSQLGVIPMHSKWQTDGLSTHWDVLGVNRVHICWEVVRRRGTKSNKQNGWSETCSNKWELLLAPCVTPPLLQRRLFKTPRETTLSSSNKPVCTATHPESLILFHHSCPCSALLERIKVTNFPPTLPELIPARGEFRSRETLVCSVSKCFRIVKVGS